MNNIYIMSYHDDQCAVYFSNTLLYMKRDGPNLTRLLQTIKKKGKQLRQYLPVQTQP